MSGTESKSPSFFRRRSFGFLVRVAISVGLCALFLSQLDFAAVREALSNVNLLLVAAAFGLNLVSQLISTYRWRDLSTSLGFKGSYGQFVLWYFEGMFFSLCLPTSIGGDVVKAIRLAAQGSQKTRSIASVFVDRLCGLAALLSIAGIAFAAQRYQWSAAVTTMVAIPVFTIVAFAFGRSVALGLRLFRGRLTSMVEKLSPYEEQPNTLTRCVGISFIVQGLNAATVACLGLAMGLTAPIAAYAVATPIVSLLATLPISVGGLGVRENGLGYFLGFYGVTFTDGVTLSLLWSAIIIALGLTGGVAFLFTRSSAQASSTSDDKPANESVHEAIATIQNSFVKRAVT